MKNFLLYLILFCGIGFIFFQYQKGYNIEKENDNIIKNNFYNITSNFGITSLPPHLEAYNKRKHIIQYGISNPYNLKKMEYKWGKGSWIKLWNVYDYVNEYNGTNSEKSNYEFGKDVLETITKENWNVKEGQTVYFGFVGHLGDLLQGGDNNVIKELKNFGLGKINAKSDNLNIFDYNHAFFILFLQGTSENGAIKINKDLIQPILFVDNNELKNSYVNILLYVKNKSYNLTDIFTEKEDMEKFLNIFLDNLYGADKEGFKNLSNGKNSLESTIYKETQKIIDIFKSLLVNKM